MSDMKKISASLSPELVRHMADLSKLALTDEEVEIFGRQFAVILDHMAVLQSVDTENVQPLYSCVDNPAHKRKDIAKNERSRKEILANAPETDGESFIVPRII